jgi:RNA-directed DNA polymerase
VIDDSWYEIFEEIRAHYGGVRTDLWGRTDTRSRNDFDTLRIRVVSKLDARIARCREIAEREQVPFLRILRNEIASTDVSNVRRGLPWLLVERTLKLAKAAGETAEHLYVLEQIEAMLPEPDRFLRSVIGPGSAPRLEDAVGFFNAEKVVLESLLPRLTRGRHSSNSSTAIPLSPQRALLTVRKAMRLTDPALWEELVPALVDRWRDASMPLLSASWMKRLPPAFHMALARKKVDVSAIAEPRLRSLLEALAKGELQAVEAVELSDNLDAVSLLFWLAAVPTQKDNPPDDLRAECARRIIPVHRTRGQMQSAVDALLFRSIVPTDRVTWWASLTSATRRRQIAQSAAPEAIVAALSVATPATAISGVALLRERNDDLDILPRMINGGTGTASVICVLNHWVPRAAPARLFFLLTGQNNLVGPLCANTEIAPYLRRRLKKEMHLRSITELHAALGINAYYLLHLIRDARRAEFCQYALKSEQSLEARRRLFQAILDWDTNSLLKIDLTGQELMKLLGRMSLEQIRSRAAALRAITTPGSDQTAWKNALLDISDDTNQVSIDRLRTLIEAGGRAMQRDAFYMKSDLFRDFAQKLPLMDVLSVACQHRWAGLALEKRFGRQALRRAIPEAVEKFGDTPALCVGIELGLSFDTSLIPLFTRYAWTAWRSFGGVEKGCVFDDLYRTYTIPKKAGGVRRIYEPEGVLKFVQRRLLDNGFHRVPVPRMIHGFVPGRSIFTNALPHVGQDLVINIDIDEFFPSIKYPLILKACARLCGGSLSPAAFALVADLCSFKGELPAGAPSSTGIANLVLSSVDKALTTICHRHGIAYTRYADDLTFSGNGDVKRIIPFVRKCLADLNLRVDEKKLNLYRRGRRQIVTGLVVNDKPNLPRRLRKRLRAAVHHRSLGQETTWHGKPMNDNELLGRLAFLKQVQPEEAERHRQKLREARKEVEGNDVIIES